MKNRKVLKTKYALVVSVLFTAFLTGCISVKPIYYDQEINTAEAAVEKFHERLDQEKYDELYEMTDKQARATKSREAFYTAMQNVHAQLGRVRSSTKLSATAKSEAGATAVETIYQTEFEKGTIKEKFLWKTKDGQAGLFSYEVVE